MNNQQLKVEVLLTPFEHELCQALRMAHDCLDQNFATTATVEGRRAMAVMNAIRPVLAAAKGQS